MVSKPLPLCLKTSFGKVVLELCARFFFRSQQCERERNGQKTISQSKKKITFSDLKKKSKKDSFLNITGFTVKGCVHVSSLVVTAFSHFPLFVTTKSNGKPTSRKKEKKKEKEKARKRIYKKGSGGTRTLDLLFTRQAQ